LIHNPGNIMKKTLLCSALLAALMSVAGGAQASLVGRDINGNAVAGNAASSVFLYDTVLNVTWLRNANVNGEMSWTGASTWAANLVVGTYDDWRLASVNDPGPCSRYGEWVSPCGYNTLTKSGNKTQYEAGQTVYNEMASLWYDTLGNTGASPMTNSGDFQNLQADVYWSSQLWNGQDLAFRMSDGLTYPYGIATAKRSDALLYALAVRSGDVMVGASTAAPSAVPISAVPIPVAAWLMASGLGAFGVAGRKRRAQQV
jgi:hypothetical protein